MSVSTPDHLPMGNSPQRASAKETLWRLSALALTHPAPEFHARISTGEFHDAFNDAWVKVTGRSLPRATPSDDFPAFEAGFITAFLHGPTGKPVASLLAGDHDAILAGLTRPVLMLNLTAFYKHFGLRAATEDEGRMDEPDHLSGMLEFMSVLCHLESRALAQGGDPSPYRRAQRDFLCRYLRPTLCTLAALLGQVGEIGLDPTIGQIVQHIADWSTTQIDELEARVGPFRDPDAPKPAMQGAAQSQPITQNLWG